jgi:hypothetical protein
VKALLTTAFDSTADRPRTLERVAAGSLTSSVGPRSSVRGMDKVAFEFMDRWISFSGVNLHKALFVPTLFMPVFSVA